MKSHEVLSQALKKTSPKAVASELGLSLSLIYRWTEASNDDGTGTQNPLDRLLQIIKISGDTQIIEWLCRQQQGSFVPDPDIDQYKSQQVLPATQEIVGQFSQLLMRISQAAMDQRITKKEADEIRLCWDQLKSCAEFFVRSCENGLFDAKQSKPTL